MPLHLYNKQYIPELDPTSVNINFPVEEFNEEKKT